MSELVPESPRVPVPEPYLVPVIEPYPVLVPEPYMSVNEVARRLQVGRDTVVRMMCSGELRYRRVRRQYRLLWSDVERAVSAGGGPGEEAP